jgi:hypothetical protein
MQARLSLSQSRPAAIWVARVLSEVTVQMWAMAVAMGAVGGASLPERGAVGVHGRRPREEPEQAHRLEGGPVELEPVGIGLDLASPDAEEVDAFPKVCGVSISISMARTVRARSSATCAGPPETPTSVCRATEAIRASTSAGTGRDMS